MIKIKTNKLEFLNIKMTSTQQPGKMYSSQARVKILWRLNNRTDSKGSQESIIWQSSPETIKLQQKLL